MSTISKTAASTQLQQVPAGDVPVKTGTVFLKKWKWSQRDNYFYNKDAKELSDPQLAKFLKDARGTPAARFFNRFDEHSEFTEVRLDKKSGMMLMSMILATPGDAFVTKIRIFSADGKLQLAEGDIVRGKLLMKLDR